jgi:hypothetical protein
MIQGKLYTIQYTTRYTIKYTNKGGFYETFLHFLPMRVFVFV